MDIIQETFSQACDQLKTITIPEGVTSIPNSAFYTCNTLDTINIPSSVRTIGQSAFYGLQQIEKSDTTKTDSDHSEPVFLYVQ